MRHVLLVDDEADIREVAAAALEALAGWRVTTAANGHEACVLAEQLRPDAIVLDVMMPGADGPTTVKELRSSPATADIPVVMLTAKAQQSELQRLAELGVAGVISKPFDPMTLHRALARALGWVDDAS